MTGTTEGTENTEGGEETMFIPVWLVVVLVFTVAAVVLSLWIGPPQDGAIVDAFTPILHLLAWLACAAACGIVLAVYFAWR